MGVHEDLIAMLMDGYAQTAAEFAAANEIKTLRARIAELEAPARAVNAAIRDAVGGPEETETKPRGKRS